MNDGTAADPARGPSARLEGPPVRVESLVKRFGELLVVDRVSFEARGGETLALLGPSGCGKTTLLTMIAGLERPDSGEIRIGGDVPLPGRAGYMFQKDLLFPWMRLLDNVALPLVVRGAKKSAAREEARAHFATFGLEGFERSWPHELSGGMRQRAALLRTWIASPDVLLLDEPFGALDAITRADLRRWLSGTIAEAGSTVLLVTHDVAEAIELADRILVLAPRPARAVGLVVNDRHSQVGRDRSARLVVEALEAES